jgi:glycosyltransferase involved in cell wall biosynthesis
MIRRVATVALDLRLLSISAKENRGTGKVARGILEGLAKLPEDAGLRFLALVVRGQAFKPPNGLFEPIVVPWTYGDPIWGGYFRELRRTGAFLRELAPDLYHSPEFFCPIGFRGPMVVTVNDCYPYPAFGPFQAFGRRFGWSWHPRFRLRYAAIWRLLRRRTTLLAPISMTTGKAVAKRHPSLADRICPIPLALDDCWFQPPAEEADRIRSRLELTRPLLIHVGGLEIQKNPEAIFEVFRNLRKRMPTATLVSVGPPQVSRPVEPGIRYLGHVDIETLRSLYAAADLLLYPSFLEGFGLPVQEAQAMGCPVVTSRGTATEEVAGGRARLVDPFDREQILRAVEETLEAPRPAPRRDIRRWSDVGRDYASLYRDQLAEARGA